MQLARMLSLKKAGTLVWLSIICLVLTLLIPAYGAAPLLEPLEDRIRMGKRMYLEGILASGEPMQADVKGDIPVHGTAFTCENCHMRSGLGSIEGGVFTTPTNGKSLFEPRGLSTGKKSSMAMGAGEGQIPSPPPPGRPAYTEESLAAALRGGIDPSGRILDSIMPRYDLDDRDMANMIAYLKVLSSELSPGVNATTLRFATVITEGVPSADSEVMLGLLERYLNKINDQAKKVAVQKVRSKMLEEMIAAKKVSYRTLALSRWTLKGTPDTWRGQLEEYYRQEPVFALLGGLAAGDWKPVHDFCEAHHIPALFPLTDYPVISDTDWYTLYLSKGFYQEGEAAARYLNARFYSQTSPTMVQIVRDSREGRALSAGFQEAWSKLDRPSPVTFMQKSARPLSPDQLKRIIAKEKPGVIILWDDAGALPAVESASAGRKAPAVILGSSSYLGEKFRSLSDKARDKVFFTYPFRLPQDDKRFERAIEPMLQDITMQGNARMIAKRTYTITRILTQALMDMKEDFYRDYFLDLIGEIDDVEFPLYERLSFGPGQRYASKGCYIVQLSKGGEPVLVKKSEWVQH
jgi:hypothetical protein